MNRAPLLALISEYQTLYPEEWETTERMRVFVEEHEDCFRQELSIGHITASAWLLDPSATLVLLTHHRKLDIWVQLGGHVDGESDVLKAALREAVEESGIDAVKAVSPGIFDIDIHRIPGRKGEPAHYHYDCRFLLQAGSDDFIISEESLALRWVPLDEVHRLTDEESMMRMQRKSHQRRVLS